MEIDFDVYRKMTAIEWFGQCGSVWPNDLHFAIQPVKTLAECIALALGSRWQDARTEAQGDLTGFLAKNHPESYDHWNKLAKVSRQKIQDDVMPGVRNAIGRIGSDALLDIVLLDLNRIALHSAYSKRFRRIPDFFQNLLAVYEHGHLPCGWDGDLGSWPEGQLMVY